jgi:hypothetical protein
MNGKSEIFLSESHRRLLAHRLRQDEENPDDVEPWEQVRDEILAELGEVKSPEE